MECLSSSQQLELELQSVECKQTQTLSDGQASSTAVTRGHDPRSPSNNGSQPCNKLTFRVAPLLPRPAPPSQAPCWWPKNEPWPSWQKYMAEVVLEGNTALIVIIVIVVLDLIVVVVELVLNSSYCFDESRPPSVDRAEEALAVIGLVLISLFMLELIARVITFGPIYYTTSFWYALDAVVVLASFIMEVTLKGVAHDLMALLVSMRLWRIIVIINNVGLIKHMKFEDKKVQLEDEIQKVQEELAAEQQHVMDLEEKYSLLREMVTEKTDNNN